MIPQWGQLMSRIDMRISCCISLPSKNVWYLRTRSFYYLNLDMIHCSGTILLASKLDITWDAVSVLRAIIPILIFAKDLAWIPVSTFSYKTNTVRIRIGWQSCIKVAACDGPSDRIEELVWSDAETLRNGCRVGGQLLYLVEAKQKP